MYNLDNMSCETEYSVCFPCIHMLLALNVHKSCSPVHGVPIFATNAFINPFIVFSTCIYNIDLAKFYMQVI